METNDNANQTPKPVRPGKKLILAILVVVLALGAAGAYLYRNRDDGKATSNNTSGEGQDDEQGTANPETLAPIDTDNLEDRYAYAQSRLDDVDEMSDTEKVTLYVGLAYDGAALDKAEARDYAATALELVPEDSDEEAEKAIRTVLLEVADGNYATAKALVLETTEE